ncbi:MAG TPA: hypothetical protein VLA82_10535 [Actinomycetota bacterium]|nr:hypothetical protein [Actinomycetota bacterium]
MLLVLLALLVVAAVADVAVESAFADGTSIVAAGQELAAGLEPEIVILSIAGASALAGILLAATIARRRRRDRSVDVVGRKEEISRAEASLEARRLMLDGRLDELQRNHDDLLARRDDLLTEVERLRHRREELADEVRDRHRELAVARRELADPSAGTSAGTPDRLTVVPDVAERGSEPPRH